MRPTRLCILARTPQLGQVKTRLAASVGAKQALVVYRQLLNKTLTHASQWQAAGFNRHVELWLTSTLNEAEQDRLNLFKNLSLHLQPQGDLGARMQHILALGLGQGNNTLIIGSDCPVLDAEVLNKCEKALLTSQLVVVPAQDGGYVLIGANTLLVANTQGLWQGPLWGTALVLQSTLQAAQKSNLSLTVLEPLFDVDTAEDYAHWQTMQR
jgi:uncharacterized protein